MRKFSIQLVFIFLLSVSQFLVAQTGREKVFLRWVADKKTVYSGESFSLHLKMYYEGSVSSPDLFPRLSIPNGWTQELRQKVQPTEERLNGQTYGVVTLKKYLVIPQKSGNLIIPAYPLTIRITVAPKPDDFFQVEQTVNQNLTAPELSLPIVPLPEPRPATFTGAVGQFTWNVNAGKDSVLVQTPLALVFRIVGTGNIPYLSMPPVVLPAGLEGFETKATDEQKVTEKGITGNKTFTQTLVGEQTGRYVLPFLFSYFDPAQKKYITLTDSVRLNITDTARSRAGIAAKVKTPDPTESVAFPTWYTRVPVFQASEKFFASVLFWMLCGLPVLLVSGVWVRSFWKNNQQQSMRWPYRRAVRSLNLARKSPLTAPELAKKIETILFEYFAARYQVSAADWYASHIGAVLQAHLVADTTTQKVVSVLMHCQEIRFSRASDSSLSIDEIKALLQSIEQQNHPTQTARMLAGGSGLWMGLLIGMQVFAATPAELYHQAQRHFQQQQFESAIASLTQLTNRGYADAVLYTNLANSYVHAGKVGLAILNYERARKLAPADSTIVGNLKTIRQKKNLVASLESPWRQALSHISADTLAWIGLGLLWIGGILAVGRIVFFRTRWNLLTRVCIGLAITGILIATSIDSLNKSDDQAIVIATTTGYYAPNAQAREMVILPEGSWVTTEDYFLDWVKVRIPDGRRAWVNKATVVKI